jgi:succinyl-diaminopimelate desuccinylase
MTAHADLSPTLQLAIDLIRRPSVTPIDADCQKQMMQRLGDAGFALEPMRIEDVDNFWATHGNTTARCCASPATPTWCRPAR